MDAFLGERVWSCFVHAYRGLPNLDRDDTLAGIGIGEGMDQLFFFTLLSIFLSALIGIVVQRRTRDRCLRNFSNQPVSLKTDDGQEYHGALQVYASGLEVTFTQQHDGPQKSDSVIIYSAEYQQVEMIGRRMGKYEARTDISKHTPFSRIMRLTRNVMNTFKDAIQQAFGVALLRAQKNQQNRLLMSQEKNYKSLGSNVLTVVANAYEPILEKYLGKRVVVEFVPDPEGDAQNPILLVGVLHEYTRTWIELHAIDHPQYFDMDVILPRGRAVLRHAHREALRLEAKQESAALKSANTIDTENSDDSLSS
jgi:hypothetical protein